MASSSSSLASAAKPVIHETTVLADKDKNAGPSDIDTASKSEPSDNDEISKGEPPGSAQAPTLPTWRYALISLGLSIGIFLSLLDSTIVATAIYTISLEFASLSTSFWVVLAYTLGYLSFATVFARASDFTGRRPAFVASLVIFLAASLGCGWSPNINALIACRAIQGIAGSGLFSLGLVILIEITPDVRRPLISGLIGVIVAVSGAVGPLVGGAFTTYVTWRWIFWINGPVAGVGIVAFLISWPNNLDSSTPKRPIRELDWVGSFLIIAASCLVVFGLQRAAGGTAFWSSPEVICTIIFGVLSWLALFAWVLLTRKTSIASAFPSIILERRRIFAGIAQTMFTGFVAFTMLYFIPLRFQLVNLTSPSAAGVRLLPLLGSSAVFSMLSGIISRKKNRATTVFIVAGALLTLGSGLLSTLPPTLEIPAKEYGFQVLAGAAQGLTYPTISMLVSFETPRADSAVVQGAAAQVRILGGSIGIAAANGLLNRQIVAALTGKLPEQLIQSLQSSNEAFRVLSPEQAELVRGAYSEAFSETMRVCLYVSVLAFLAAFATWTRHPRHPVGDRIRAAKEEEARKLEAGKRESGGGDEEKEVGAKSERSLVAVDDQEKQVVVDFASEKSDDVERGRDIR